MKQDVYKRQTLDIGDTAPDFTLAAERAMAAVAVIPPKNGETIFPKPCLLYTSTPETIKRLADRHRGIGFDQLLIVEPPYDPDLDFHYRIFNADGSEVSQCGNGARCFARFVTLKGLTNKKDIAVSTQKGKMVLTVKEDGQIRVNMGEPIWEPNKIPFTANKFEKNYILRTDVQTVLCGAVSMGNPHCVVQVDNIRCV